jgi:hypothetical protein
MWIIAAFRVAGAFPVLRWPLAGAFIALFVDLSDLFLRDWIHLGGVNDYQSFDKWLDQAYMLTFLAVALRWDPLPRNIAVALYAFRLAGFITFELSGEREVLILFPNLFEYWFIFIAALKTFGWEEPEVIRNEKGEMSQESPVAFPEGPVLGTQHSALGTPKSYPKPRWASSSPLGSTSAPSPTSSSTPSFSARFGRL